MDMQRKNILIVEDEYITALDLKTQLILKGHYGFDIVATGEDAIKRASLEKIDLIFMDIKLKGEIDGIDAAKAIKEIQNVPIVFVSGNSDLLKSNRLKNFNPVGILHKPITEYELTDIINRVFLQTKDEH
jgi:CheY-like chemotaxis protein